ncbi:MAG: M14 metallopeptidase family protein [Bacteroidota bacterium]
MNFEELFIRFKETNLHGRYIKLSDIEPLLLKLNTNNKVTVIGESVLGKPIYKYVIGTGKTKLLIWSQMHGNESTTTKALFDLFNYLNSGSENVNSIVTNLTLIVVPMLNPDGALLYTRENANKIDLNRDFKDFSQPESLLLKKLFVDTAPDYCFNMHDQRTIFGIESSVKPATVSFLAPSYDQERQINETRGRAMSLIGEMNKVLKKLIPGQIGRFDDSFNINCAGDCFQFLNSPTVLFEAGHYPLDYDREIARKYIFIALITALKSLGSNDIIEQNTDEYLNIPQNKVMFCDFLYKNVKINYDDNEIITNFAAQYKEELIDDKLVFNAYISEIGDLNNYFGHFEFDAKELPYSDSSDNKPQLNQKADFCLGKNIKIINGLIKM